MFSVYIFYDNALHPLFADIWIVKIRLLETIANILEINEY